MASCLLTFSVYHETKVVWQRKSGKCEKLPSKKWKQIHGYVDRKWPFQKDWIRGSKMAFHGEIHSPCRSVHCTYCVVYPFPPHLRLGLAKKHVEVIVSLEKGYAPYCCSWKKQNMESNQKVRLDTHMDRKWPFRSGRWGNMWKSLYLSKRILRSFLTDQRTSEYSITS